MLKKTALFLEEASLTAQQVHKIYSPPLDAMRAKINTTDHDRSSMETQLSQF